MHSPHVQPTPDGFVGGLIPAAAQLNPEDACSDLALAFAAGFGASQTVHFSVALAGFESMHCEHDQVSPAAFAGGFIPAAAQLKPVVSGAFVTVDPLVDLEKSKVGREDSGVDLAVRRASR